MERRRVDERETRDEDIRFAMDLLWPIYGTGLNRVAEE